MEAGYFCVPRQMLISSSLSDKKEKLGTDRGAVHTIGTGPWGGWVMAIGEPRGSGVDLSGEGNQCC